jgi:hypothetical protein
MFVQDLCADYLVVAADLVCLRHLKTIKVMIWLFGCLMDRRGSIHSQ